MRVLYVEDNPVDIDLLKRHLQKTTPHIAVDAVRTQKEALSVLRGPRFCQYDLVLTDMRLPDGDGLAILSYIRANSLPLAVVVLTGQGDEETAVSVLKSGADDYLSKKKGYLERLPKLFEHAIRVYRSGEIKRAKSVRVLYLEHNPSDIDLTLRHFSRYAAHIQMTAISAADRFRALLQSPTECENVDVFLLDYRLPGANALELYKDLILDSGCDIPTVLISGKGDEEIAATALKIGVFDYVTKNQGYLFKLPSVIENAYYSVQFQREHEALAKSEARYRSMMEALIDPIYICSLEGEVEYLNPAMIRRLGRDARADRCHEVIHRLDRQCGWCDVDDVRSGKVVAYDIKSPLDNRNYHVTSMPIENEHGTLSKMTIFRDTTDYLRALADKEKAQKQMLQSQKLEAIGNLAGGIAHDFNNILSSIIGFSELALEDTAKGTPMESNLQEIYVAGKRAKDLVRQILLFARKSDERLQPIRIDVIVKEVLGFIRSSIPSNIDIRQDLASDAHVMGNPTQVHQIMMNLCTNAAQAMEEDGGIMEITLSETTARDLSKKSHTGPPAGRYLELRVSDTGTGIAPDILDTVFDPYFTTKNPVREREWGWPW
jgi:CheY-like chemotaxis protein/nitrogen-specific signal transduction histidine kinase